MLLEEYRVWFLLGDDFLVCFRVLCTAWFGSGFLFIRQSTVGCMKDFIDMNTPVLPRFRLHARRFVAEVRQLALVEGLSTEFWMFGWKKDFFDKNTLIQFFLVRWGLFVEEARQPAWCARCLPVRCAHICACPFRASICGDAGTCSLDAWSKA